MKNRAFGWIPDVPDQRDMAFQFAKRVKGPKKLPARTDLRHLCPLIEDQEDLGACTAFAITAAAECLQAKHGVPYTNFSCLFLYYNERKMIGTVQSDSGAYLRDGFKSMAKTGVCHDTSWPYVTKKFTTRPPLHCYSEAADHQVIEYQRLLTFKDMQNCLALGYPFVFGFSVYESFMSDTVADTGIAPMPKRTERLLGGHAVLAVGYDNTTERLLVRNSWGPDWGMKGYFTLPYAYVKTRNLSDDFWRMTRGEQM